MISIGIDPGQTGAIAAINDGQVIALHDMPTSPRLHGKGQEVEGGQLATKLMDIRSTAGGKQVVASLEAVSAMPGQGGSSMFRFGESFGVVKGVLRALQIPYVLVTPQKWKKASGLIGKDKDASRTLAIQQHPEVADMLTRKKDNGRADAICLAEYGTK